MTAYLDASVLLPIIVDEPASQLVDRFMEGWTDRLFVSDFAAAEVASALSRLMRMHLIADVDARERLADFDSWRAGGTDPIDVQPADVRLANVFVRRFELMLRAPDALHAALCRRNDMTLVTLDRRLADAAGQLGVDVHVPA